MAEEYQITVERRPFILRPDVPPEGVPREPRPGEEEDQMREPIRSRALEEGLVMRRPSLTPYSMLALEATEYAKEKGLDSTFHYNTMKAYWGEGVDLGSMDVLRRLAEESGLDWSDLRPRLESRQYMSQVEEMHMSAVGLGIHGIPAFLIGHVLFTGAQPYPVFQKVMEKVLAEQG